MQKPPLTHSVLSFFLALVLHTLPAQTEAPALTQTILFRDSLFWDTYNRCDVEGFRQFFTADVEFYHDKSGLTTGLENFIDIIKKSLCGNEARRLRRAVVDGTLEVYPLENAGVVYGAVLTGEHVFYLFEKDKGEHLDGLAKFTHVWLLKDGIWKMARVLSYDHGPAPQSMAKKAIVLPPDVLARYVGTYDGPQTKGITIEVADNGLTMRIQEYKLALLPETENRFFIADRELVFEFVLDDKKQVLKLVVWEKEQIAEEAVPVKQ